MSWFKTAAGAGLVALMSLSVACGGGSSSSSTSNAPSAVTFTDVFTGSLSQGGTSYGDGSVNHFTIHQAGNISATITKLAPLGTITVGLGLGVYDAGTDSCTLQLFGDSAKLNLTLNASVQVAGELCVGVYDVGNVNDPITYEVTIVHT